MAEVTPHKVTPYWGDAREVIRGIADASLDACVTDPPYALVSIGRRFGKPGSAPAMDGVYARASAGFMGKAWDTGETAFDPKFWREVLRVLKPGAHLVAFGGTRSYHRLACAIEDAGFEIRDMVAWLYGSGFPKSHDVAKGIDKRLGAVRERQAPQRRANASVAIHQSGFGSPTWSPQVEEAVTEQAEGWEGWGTALKPALEPIVLARKPLAGTVAANVLAHGCGALNIDAARVGEAMRSRSSGEKISDNLSMAGGNYSREIVGEVEGRWPANVCHDGSSEVEARFPETDGQIGGVNDPNESLGFHGGAKGQIAPGVKDSGSAARFFYTAKADAEDRLGSKHPTVKPVDLMRWLCRLVTPPGGVILDPFAGTGTTGLAALAEGFSAILIEREAEYFAHIERRLTWSRGESTLTTGQHIAERREQHPPGGLFEGVEP